MVVTIAIMLTITSLGIIIIDKNKNFINVEKNNINHAPFVVAKANKTCGKSPLEILFFAEGKDIDNDNISFLWNFKDGSYSTKRKIVHIYENIGRYNVTLTVKDEYGKYKKDNIEINVLKNHFPVAKIAVKPTKGLWPLKIHLSSKQSYDPDGKIVKYQWSIQGFLTKIKNNQPTCTHNLLLPGYYTVKLTVTDDNGAIDTASESIKIKAPLTSFLLFLLYLTYIKDKVNNLINQLQFFK